MSKIEINKLTNANVYLNGNNLLGRAEEVELPQIKHKMAEHKALGMIGSAEFFSGIDKMECKIKWNALYPSVSLEIPLSRASRLLHYVVANYCPHLFVLGRLC